MKNPAMLTLKWFLLALVTLSLDACGGKKDEKGADSKGGDDKTEAGSGEVASVVLMESGLWEGPSAKTKWLKAVTPGSVVTYLGEEVMDKDDPNKYVFQKVRLKSGNEGWMLAVFLANDASPAVVLDEKPVYSEPDLASLTDKKYETFDIIAIVEQKDDWMKVTGKRKGGQWVDKGWVKSGDLSSDEKDIAVAVQYNKALTIKDEAKKEDAIIKLLNNKDLAGSPLMSKVEMEFSMMMGGDPPGFNEGGRE